ncbi:MAG: AraC family transcriptional regulator N-terminal domain-containing protein, partial [Sphingobium sp.]
MEQIKELAALIGRHAVAEGLTDVAVPRLGLFKSCTETMPQHVLYEPALCIVAQGRKRALLGDAAYIYDVASFLVVSVDLPVVGCVIEATQEEPYLSFRLDLNLPVLSELMLEHGGDGGVRRGGVGLGLSRVTPGLLDAAVRLLRLLDTPEDIAALAPLMEREILYRLLVGEQGAMLRHIACQDSRLSQISRAIAWIKGNFAAPFSIERLAAEAGMSASSVHHHF